MSGAHTQGPWEWSEGGGRLFYGADTYSTNVLVIHDPVWRPTSADKALIAAAPDMLEALEKAAAHVEHMAVFARVDAKVKRKAAAREKGTSFAIECLNLAKESDEEEARHQAVADVMRAAIAKARGQ